MRKTIITLIILFFVYLLAGCSPKTIEGKYEISPANPQPGEEITVYYDAAKTDLKDSKSIDIIVYSYNVDLEETELYPMKKDGNLWTAKIKSKDGIKGILLKFEDSNNYNLVDANDKKGYMVPMFMANGKPMPCAEAGYAYSLVSWGGSAGIETDKEAAFSIMEKAIKNTPHLLENYLGEYCYTISRLKRDSGNPIIKEILDEVITKDSLNENQLSALTSWYDRIGEEELSAKYKDLLVEKYPNGDKTLDLLANDILTKESSDEKVAALNEFIKTYPEFDNLDMVKAQIAYSMFNSDEDEAAFKFLLENFKDIPTNYSMYIADGLSKKNSDYGVQCYSKAIDVARSEIDNPTKTKPIDATEKEWLEQRQNFLGDCLVGAASTAYSMENYSDAVKYYDEAIATFNLVPKGKFYMDPNELPQYAKALLKEEQLAKATEVIEKNVGEGEATEEMLNLLKEVYILNNGSEDGYETYSSKFEAAAHQMMIDKLNEEMISEPAPDFSLNTLDGKEVSLSDYKGKTVIIDFWATWCGPCIRSFPAMQIAVNDFADDESVEFLFVNTWERVENKLENAAKFISDNKYNFNVLMDVDNAVVTKFGVNGIPNKFVVDKDGNIRFDKSGFDGNIKHTVDEIKAMISLLQ